jgi:putative transposase
MIKTFEYRLYSTVRQRRLLTACLAESRCLYNEMLQATEEHHENTGEFLFKYALTAQFKGRSGPHVPASTVEMLADRLDKALKRRIIQRGRGKRAGFPRFKGPNRWHSIQLRQWGKDVSFEEGRLKVPAKLGRNIKVKQHRPLGDEPKTAHLTLRADGHWYVLIVCDVEKLLSQPDRAIVGLDVGLKTFLADSEGNTVENPRHYRRSKKNLRRAQRKMCRRKKGSKRCNKAAREVAKIHLKIARQRKDFLHKVARRYADGYSTLVVEDLKVVGMVRNRCLASSIHDASWSKFIEILEYKAESVCARVVKVPARLTTQKCHGCNKVVPKPLSVRMHVCPHCGHAEDRDVNAARNFLSAWTGPSEANVTDSRERAPRSRLPLGSGVVTRPPVGKCAPGCTMP